MSKLRGVLFDMDGTLVDSNPAHALCWIQALTEFGQNPNAEEIRRSIGMGGDKVIPMQTPWSDQDPQGQALAQRRGVIFKEQYLPTLTAFDGAEELLRNLHKQGLLLAVASSAQAKELDPLLDIAGVRPFLAEKTSSGDAEHSKPDPDILAVALQRLGLQADEVIMIGDTPYDLSAARKLSIRPLAFLTGGWSQAELHEAEWIFQGPAQLLEAMGEDRLEDLLQG